MRKEEIKRWNFVNSTHLSMATSGNLQTRKTLELEPTAYSVPSGWKSTARIACWSSTDVTARKRGFFSSALFCKVKVKIDDKWVLLRQYQSGSRSKLCQGHTLSKQSWKSLWFNRQVMSVVVWKEINVKLCIVSSSRSNSRKSRSSLGWMKIKAKYTRSEKETTPDNRKSKSVDSVWIDTCEYYGYIRLLLV